MASSSEEEPIKYGEIKETLSVKLMALGGGELSESDDDGALRRLNERVLNAVSELYDLGVKVEVNYP